jgi:anti-anti-sigma factor
MTFGIATSVEEREGVTIIRLKGRLDATSTPVLEGKIKPFLEKSKMILIDFAEVDYLSSAGMRLLLSATKKIKAKNGKLVFCAIDEDVMEIMKMAGFDRILTIYATEKEALAALAL